MVEWIISQPATWGFLGAFIYAAPRLSACVFTQRDAGLSCWRCIVEFAFALIIGTIGAAAFQPAIGEMFGRVADHDMRAIAAALGLFSNRAATKLVDVVPDALGARVERMLKGEPK